MRKLAFLTLGMYISIIMSSFVFAADSVPIKKLCKTLLSLDNSEYFALMTGVTPDTYADKYKTYTTAVQTVIDGSSCGVVNANYGYEMSTCATAKPPQLVTEILEPIGSATTMNDGSKIIDLYKGICCAGLSPDGSYCAETRIVYFDTYTHCTDNGEKCQKIQWLISSTGAGILKTYVKQIYVFGAGIVGFIAVATIVGSGIQISVSGATGDITAAKDRITQSIMGIALLFLSALILYTINPTFFY